MPVEIPKHIQLAVDTYVDLYREYKELEAKVQELKSTIEPFMKETGYDALLTSNGTGKVELLKQQRVTSTTRYSTYTLEDIATYLTPSLRKKCIVEVVDKDKLESLCKLGEISSEVLERKAAKEMYIFKTNVHVK